jgi:hypothetical protein
MQESTSNNPSIDSARITIRTIPDGFAFYTSTTEGNEPKVLKLPAPIDFPDQFEDYITSEGWANQNDLFVTFIDFTKRFLLLPNSITNKEQIKTFFDFQFFQEKEEAYQIFSTPLSDGKQSFNWEMPLDRYNIFKRLFTNLDINTSTFLMIEWTLRQAASQQKTILMTHLFGASMLVCVANSYGLIFANTFPIKKKEEIPYFLLRCMEQLSLNPEQTRCVICSETISGQVILETLHPYIQQIEMAAFTSLPDEPLQLIGNKQ